MKCRKFQSSKNKWFIKKKIIFYAMFVAEATMRMFCSFVTIVIFIVVTFIAITLSITRFLREIGFVETAPLKMSWSNLLISVGLALLLNKIIKSSSSSSKKINQLQRGLGPGLKSQKLAYFEDYGVEDDNF